MKFTTTKNNLFSALNETNRVIPVSTTLPILSCVLIKAQKQKLTLIATDLEQTVVSKLKGKVLEEGETAVPCGRFLEIIAALPNEEITLNVKEDQEIEINSSQVIILLCSNFSTPSIRTTYSILSSLSRIGNNR